MWTKPIADELGVSIDFTSNEIPKTIEYLLVSTYLHLYCTQQNNLNTVKDIRKNDWVFMDNYDLYKRWDLYDDIPKMRFNLGIFVYANNNDKCIIKVSNICLDRVLTDINKIYSIVPHEIYNIKLKVLENLLINSSRLKKMKYSKII